MHPREIEKNESGNQLTIIWQDGTTTTYKAADLRAACGCSACGTTSSDSTRPRSLMMMTDASRTIEAVHLIDSKRIRIVWSDGHDQSWYTFAALREMAHPSSTSSPTSTPPSATGTTL